MDELARWYGEQLDEDEQIARGADPGPWKSDSLGRHDQSAIKLGAPTSLIQFDGSRAAANGMHVARHDPARVLREIDAKRQVITSHAELVEKVTELSAIRGRLSAQGRNTVMTDGELESAIHQRDALLGVLRLLALPHADRPGYREEWRP